MASSGAASGAFGLFLVLFLHGTVFASLGGEAVVGPTAAKGLGESLDDELARSSFSSQDKASVKEIVGKVHRKHKSQLKLGETLKAAVEAKLGTQVPITKSIQKIIDDVADELSRTCAATALSAGKGPKEKTSAADSNLTTATTNKNAKGPAGDVAQHKGGGTFDWTQCKSEVSCSRACSALRHHTLLLTVRADRAVTKTVPLVPMSREGFFPATRFVVKRRATTTPSALMTSRC